MGEIVRVFPRRTKATPTDDLAFVGNPPMGLEADEVHVSVAFTYDIPEAERLARVWEVVGPTQIGGPAMGDRGEEFIPGRYLKPGYIITSRGCPNHCWFCSVPKREGPLRELPIPEGWNLLDDNLLACSDKHIRAVFAMLDRQPHKAEFSGGLEAARLQPWHVDLLTELKPAQMFFAYDTPDDYEPLVRAAGMLREAGFSNTQLRAYVLIGGPRDTMEKAQQRLVSVYALGIMPFAMLYRDTDGNTEVEWRRFQRIWALPAAIRSAFRDGGVPSPQHKSKNYPQTESLLGVAL